MPTLPPLRPVAKDRARVEAEYARTQDVRRHRYLEEERCIPAAMFGSDRFVGCVRIDERGNAIFPHVDREGLCGYEIKNRGFTGFSAGGTKGLWFSRLRREDHCLAFCESAIDALSYAVLFFDARTRYVSSAGRISPGQCDLIEAAIAHMPAGSTIVAAMDSDAQGKELADIVRQAIERSGRADLEFRNHEPSGFKDWNNQLRGRKK